MPTEREIIGRIRRALEPLEFLYKKAIVEACKEPFEVRLMVKESAGHLSENFDGAQIVHIIGGESLWAVHEAWQEYCRMESELVEEPTYLTAQEREWLKWFYQLSDEDKQIVEECGNKDISVTSANLDEMKDALKDQEAKVSDTIDQV